MADKGNGFIVLWRSFLDWEWYDDVNVKVLFLELLLTANHKENEWRGMTIKRGQVVTSLNKLSSNTGLTIQQTRTALNKLKSTHEITYSTHSNFTIITIKNWDKYQNSNKQNNNEITFNQQAKQQTNNKRVTTNNNDNNVTNINNICEVDKNAVAKMVIDYLNRKTGKTYKYTDSNLKFILARMNEGYTKKDCETVIDKKCKEWLHNAEMQKYLRPATLFNATKFESYLNDKAVGGKEMPAYMSKKVIFEQSNREDIENVMKKLRKEN